MVTVLSSEPFVNGLRMLLNSDEVHKGKIFADYDPGQKKSTRTNTCKGKRLPVTCHDWHQGQLEVKLYSYSTQAAKQGG